MRLPAILLLAAAVAGSGARTPPNIIVILADDLGFSDLGCYGGEIRTPTIDRLAANGIRFTQFTNSARCCPSRASLLTGQYPHAAGFPAMSGSIPRDCATIPEVLRPAGYRTLMVGKWHLGKPGPVERGFDEYFGMVHGFGSFWDPKEYTRLPQGRPERAYPEGKFYATDAFADTALDFISDARKASKPYFLYLAFNAPHFPLHAPKEDVDRYAATYAKGWDVLREERFRRQRELGIADEHTRLAPRSTIPPNRVADPHGWSGKENPAWESIDADRRADLVRRMAVYAAMVDRMDRAIGRLVDDLEKAGELRKTLILFLSDNGACAEWDPWGFDVKSGPDNVLHRGEALDRMGQPGTYHSTGSGWANASNTPFRLYKHYSHEGGVVTPLVVHWPDGTSRRNAIDRRPGHLMDLLATCAGAAGAEMPKDARPTTGVSLLPALKDEASPARTIFYEHEGSRAVRDGRWKLVALKGQPWELYDLDRDRTELDDLASKNPDRVAAMSAAWDGWATQDWKKR